MDQNTQTGPERILVFEPHPDDLAFQIGGSVAKWMAQGREVFVCTVTNGNNSTFDPAVSRARIREIMLHEHAQAMDYLGVDAAHYVQWEFDDLGLEEPPARDELLPRMIRLIRDVRPATVVTLDPAHNWLEENPDHRAVALCGFQAANLAAHPHLYTGGPAPHFVSRALFYMTENPDVFVDIAGAPLETKIALGLMYESQLDLMLTEARQRLAGLGIRLPLFDLPGSEIWPMMCRQLAEDAAAECVAWRPERPVDLAEGFRLHYPGVLNKIRAHIPLPDTLAMD